MKQAGPVEEPHPAVVLPGTTRFVDRRLPGGLSERSRLQFTDDRQGRVLTATTGGLARWEMNRWRSLDSSNGLDSHNSTALLVDREGLFWLGVSGKDLTRWLGYGQ